MADKKLNNVSTLTSSTLASNDYAYVEDVSASNEQKKVTITDLAKVVGGLRTDLSGNEDLNNITTIGVYMAYSSTETSTIGHIPATGYGMRLEVVPLRRDNTQIMQTVYMANSTIDTYVRRYNNGSWNDWKMVTKS